MRLLELGCARSRADPERETRIFRQPVFVYGRFREEHDRSLREFLVRFLQADFFCSTVSIEPF